MACFGMKPRDGHFKAMKCIYGYIKMHPQGHIPLNMAFHDWSPYDIKEYDWKEFYPDAIEDLPPDMPKAIGTKAQITIYKACWSCTWSNNTSFSHWCAVVHQQHGDDMDFQATDDYWNIYLWFWACSRMCCSWVYYGVPLQVAHAQHTTWWSSFTPGRQQ